MIRVSGRAELTVPFNIVLNMSGAQFEALSDSRANDLIEETIDWLGATRNAEVSDIDIWEYDEVNKDE